MEPLPDDSAVFRRLIFESSVAPLNFGYRRSFLRAVATVVWLYAKSRRRRPVAEPDLSGEAACFGFFKNELTAIDGAIRANPAWQRFALSLHGLSGLDWRRVLAPAPRQLPRFLAGVARIGGWAAVRDFAYPFVGYLVYRHMLETFARRSGVPAIVTTNLVHPLSVGIHLAAVKAGLPTIFWEHAMTPRMIAKDMGYSRYYVHCPHTRAGFLDAGLPADKVQLIEGGADLAPVPLGDVTKLRRIAVSVNDLDNLGDVEQTLQLLGSLGRTAVLRVHDSDKRFPELARIAARNAVALSNAARTRIETFLPEVDLVVAGNSNVVLDCLKARRRVLYFWPGDPGLFDYYGIVAAVKCESATSLDGLAARLGRMR